MGQGVIGSIQGFFIQNVIDQYIIFNQNLIKSFKCKVIRLNYFFYYILCRSSINIFYGMRYVIVIVLVDKMVFLKIYNNLIVKQNLILVFFGEIYLYGFLFFSFGWVLWVLIQLVRSGMINENNCFFVYRGLGFRMVG